MFYIKNLPVWERLLRVGLGIALVIYLLASGISEPWTWLSVAAITILVLTGLIGFCPACALAGRRLAKRNAPTQQ